MSIEKKSVFCKPSGKISVETLILVLLIVFVGISSFALGRLSVQEGGSNESPIEVYYPENAGEVLGVQAGSEVVASKDGQVYYFTKCSGANRIKEENKIYFDSIEIAKRAGLRPASNCEGLY